MTPKQNLNETILSLEKTYEIITNDLTQAREQLKTLKGTQNEIDRMNAYLLLGNIQILEKMSRRIIDALDRAKFDPKYAIIPDYY